MATSAVLTLDERRVKKDGTCPIVLRISHHGKTTGISLGTSIDPKFWDKNSRRIKSSFKGTDSLTRLNNSLQKKLSHAIDTITILSDKEELDYLSLSEVRAKILNHNKQISFTDFAKHTIEELVRTNRFGNARCYQTSLASLQNFSNKSELQFNEINYQFITQFEAKHLEQGNSLNGLSVYLRTIRAIFNKAIKADIIPKEMYPFNKYTIRSKPTQKRAISIESIRKIEKLAISEDHPCFHTRNYFLASFYLLGANFTDLAFFKVGNIVNDRLFYKRKKTGRPMDIKISEKLRAILDYYCNGKSKGEFIFPILKRESLSDQNKDIRWARSRFNKRLKVIADACGIDEKLTSYVSRHTFATSALNSGVPITAISQMLGHESIKTTQVYLQSLPSSVIDDYADKIFN